jgi:hypothetical protein
VTGKATYDRCVATCYLEDMNIDAELVRIDVARLPAVQRRGPCRNRAASRSARRHREVILMVSTVLTKSATFVLVAALSLSAPSRAEILTRRTASEGFSCYSPGPMVPEDQGGWTADGISEDEILPSIEKEDEIDIIYKNSSGMRSMEEGSSS